MADVMKQILSHMDGMAKFAVADAAAKVMAAHCDKRIAKVRKAIQREEKYMFRLLRARHTGGIMAGDIEGAFHRLLTALDK